MPEKRYNIPKEIPQTVDEPIAVRYNNSAVVHATGGKNNDGLRMEMELRDKIERGEDAIRRGNGICQIAGESNEAFFERLCTM